MSGEGEPTADRSRLLVLVPLAVTALFAAIHWAWLARDSTALYWDMGRHGLNALRNYDLLTQSGLPLRSWLSALSEGPDPYYPPLYYWLAAIPIALFGRSADAIALTGVPFALLFNLSAFFVTRRIAGRLSAVIACFVASSIPILFDFTHQVMLDFPLTAMVAATLWVLFERPFDSLPRAAVLGLCVALGLLTKWTYPAFVGLPCLLVLVQATRARRWGAAPPALLSLAIAAAAALPWFLLHRDHLLHVGEAQSHVPGVTGQSWSQVGERLAAHWQALFSYQMDLPSVAMLLIALVAALAVGEWRRRTSPLLWCLVSSVLVWGVLGKHQDVRYSMPQLAAAVPLIAALPVIVARWLGKRVRLGLQAFTLVWCVFAVVNIGWAPATFNRPWLQDLRIAPQFAFHSGPPKATPSEEPLRSALRSIAASGRRPIARFIETDEFDRGLDGWSAQYYAAESRVQLSDWDPSFTLLQVGPAGAKGEGAGLWLPVPDDPSRGIRMTRELRPWERRDGLLLSDSVPTDPTVRYYEVETDGTAEGALVVFEGEREVAGAQLRRGAAVRWMVRAGQKGRIETWSKEPVKLRVAPAPESTRRDAALGVDVGFDYPVGAELDGAGRLVNSPRRSAKALVAGPYLSLPPGDYRVGVRWSPTAPMDGTQRLTLRVALRRQKVEPVTADLSTVPGSESLLEARFDCKRVSRRAEFVVEGSGLAAGQVELRERTLWLLGTDQLETLLSCNSERFLRGQLFQLR